MTAPVAAGEAVEFIAFVTGWGEGYAPVFFDGATEPEFHHRLGGRASQRLAERAARWDFQENRQVEIGLPEGTADTGGPRSCSVVWAWVDSADALEQAFAFRQRPSLVLQMGSSNRRLLMWALSRRARCEAIVDANRRIAYHFGAVQKLGLPEALRIPLPGTFLRAGRTRPVPVLVKRMELDDYPLETIVGRLKDPPATDGWRKRRETAES